MKTAQIKIVLLFIAVVTLGCHNKNNADHSLKLLGTWRINSEEVLSANSGGQRSLVTRVLSFFPDGSYTQLSDSGDLLVGKWELSKEQDFITFIDSKKLYTSFQLGVNEYGKQTFVFENPALNRRLKFIKEYDTLFNYKNDPLYYDNNKWREKPASASSDKEIKEKVANYVRHLSQILSAAKERKQDVVSFEFSLGPIKIYNGGIGVHPFSLVPACWKKCFFNETEAMKGYQEYASAVEKTDYRLAGSGSWLEDDGRILDAVHDVLSK